ncbi:hypothetical protein DFH07DRAFT_941505, partial [Mycena maculata]
MNLNNEEKINLENQGQDRSGDGLGISDSRVDRNDRNGAARGRKETRIKVDKKRREAADRHGGIRAAYRCGKVCEGQDIGTDRCGSGESIDWIVSRRRGSRMTQSVRGQGAEESSAEVRFRPNRAVLRGCPRGRLQDGDGEFRRRKYYPCTSIGIDAQMEERSGRQRVDSEEEIGVVRERESASNTSNSGWSRKPRENESKTDSSDGSCERNSVARATRRSTMSGGIYDCRGATQILYWINEKIGWERCENTLNRGIVTERESWKGGPGRRGVQARESDWCKTRCKEGEDGGDEAWNMKNMIRKGGIATVVQLWMKRRIARASFVAKRPRPPVKVLFTYDGLETDDQDHREEINCVRVELVRK